jgi:hypothetical protein
MILRGYRLKGEQYETITDGRSEPLKLRLQIEDTLIGFYREDTGEKLLAPNELVAALHQETQARQNLEQQLEQAQQAKELARRHTERLAERLRGMGVNPDEI